MLCFTVKRDDPIDTVFKHFSITEMGHACHPKEKGQKINIHIGTLAISAAPLSSTQKPQSPSGQAIIPDM